MNLQKTLLTTSVIGALCYAPVKAGKNGHCHIFEGSIGVAFEHSQQ